MDTITLIETGKLVCPVTRQRLVINGRGDTLTTVDGGRSYPLLHGSVPILLDDPRAMAAYANDSAKMAEEYLPERETLVARLTKMQQRVIPDFRKKSSNLAFKRVIMDRPGDALCLSIGGGPQRQHPNLVNLNVGPFPNVDVVGDAHLLPCADASVDAIFCEAVIEHLRDPVRAVQEMHRVLKPGGEAFVVTPFMQAYHGYPHHYQNFTLTGHRYLFTAHGFSVPEAGTCVGPVYTIVNLVSKFIRYYFHMVLAVPLLVAWNLLGIILRPIDLLLNERENSHMLASTTYLVARKE